MAQSQTELKEEDQRSPLFSSAVPNQQLGMAQSDQGKRKRRGTETATSHFEPTKRAKPDIDDRFHGETQLQAEYPKNFRGIQDRLIRDLKAHPWMCEVKHIRIPSIRRLAYLVVRFTNSTAASQLTKSGLQLKDRWVSFSEMPQLPL